MDWLELNILFFFINWWPWVNFFYEDFFLQILVLYTIYLIYFNNNYYYILFYIFIFFFYIGLFLSFYNFDLFTAFLWLTESVIIFISIIFLFYLNIYGNINKLNLVNFSIKYFSLFLIFFLFIVFFVLPSNTEITISNNFDIFFLWDNYYDALLNDFFNDLVCLYLSYYILNSIEFIVIGLLLLFGSVICVNLNKFNLNIKLLNYYNLFVLFDFFKDFIDFFLMRKQNLTKQTKEYSFTKIFKKK